MLLLSPTVLGLKAIGVGAKAAAEPTRRAAIENFMMDGTKSCEKLKLMFTKME